MINNNTHDSPGRKGYSMFSIIFLAVLLLLFFCVAFISWPQKETINLNRESVDITNSKSKWCEIEADGYDILDEIGEYHTDHSTFLFPKTYYYFAVSVKRDDGEDYVIAVRTNRKTASLRNGIKPFLYGVLSEIPDSIIDIRGVEGAGEKVYDLVLNDNDQSSSGNRFQSVFFFILGIIDIFILRRIIINLLNSK